MIGQNSPLPVTFFNLSNREMEKTLLKALNQGQVDRVVRLLLPSFRNNCQICIDTMRKALSGIEIYVQVFELKFATFREFFLLIPT